MPIDPNEKLLQYLNEAHALEAGLVQTLGAHIGMTPRGEYRDLLERHLGETTRQTQALERRLSELGVGRSPLQMVVGIAETVVGQGMAAAMVPFNVLRGGSPEEKLLKNAKDEASSEALEIATYDGLEALAHELGDEKTATMAREHRTQEEVFLKDLRKIIPALAVDVVDSEVRDDPSYDIKKTGAADVAKAAGGRFVREADKATAKVEDVASDAKDAASGAKDAVTGAVSDAEDEVEDAVSGLSEEAEQLLEGEPDHDRTEEPIANYDKLNADQVIAQLDGLDAEHLAAVDGLERATKDRKKVLDRVAALRQKRVDEELARLS